MDDDDGDHCPLEFASLLFPSNMQSNAVSFTWWCSFDSVVLSVKVKAAKLLYISVSRGMQFFLDIYYCAFFWSVVTDAVRTMKIFAMCL